MEYQTLLIVVTALAVVVLSIAVFRATTCPAGWKVWLFYRIACLHSFLFTRCTATNACTFPETGPAIIVGNHSSPADPMLLWLGHFAQFKNPRLRVIGFMMAREYYELNGLLNWMCRALESIPVERSGQDMAPIREALRRLQNGHWLGLFPEGGINVESPDERLRPGGTGVAWLALKSKAPVIPVLIRNAPRSRSMAWVFFKRTHTTLTYGSPVDLSHWQRPKPSHSDLIEVTDKIMQSVADLGGLKITPASR
ncbi:MAG: 1-acyl-sn-glycerol-3-phosphate acyltransferase [Planctomycetota bacterium]|jgi:1-acyl-sn-glycerol-3-phosphate acyltransferase|nr:MAG: 1-acyl-sn-glycerol-3-phosphate acyltransferase [Planctomycetota bacterium]